MTDVPGTTGYEKVVDAFVEASRSFDFEETSTYCRNYLPTAPGRVLDAGCGAGQNAAALASLGHAVVAIDPLPAFLNRARSTYAAFEITWLQDCLPRLESLGEAPLQFDFILVEAVLHHLNDVERAQAMARISELLDVGGCCALSLRNGPAGAGKHVFPTNGTDTATRAIECGLEVLVHLPDQPSLMKNKPGVTWTRMVVRKPNR